MGLKEHMSSELKVRIFLSILLLVLGFIGVIVTDVNKTGAWHYWQFLCIAYALVSLFWSWHRKRSGWKTAAITIWHELAHWLTLMAFISIAAYLVKVGLVGRFEASILTLLLLGMATLLAGIYIEWTFVILGIVLGFFAVMIAFLDEYLYNILLPVTLAVALALILLIRHAHKKLTHKP